MTLESKQTCISCGKAYSQAQKSHITELMQKEDIRIKHYPSTCLACIILELAVEKSQYQANLISATTALKLHREAYQQASNNHQGIASKYTYYDRQANYIQFFIAQKQAKAHEKTPKPKSKYRKTIKVNQAKQADIIAELLNSLTPEQQKLVLAKTTASEKATLASEEVL